MANIKLIASYPSINYTVIYRNGATIQPFICAYEYDPKSKTWAQGHYFETLAQALTYISMKSKNEDEEILYLDF